MDNFFKPNINRVLLYAGLSFLLVALIIRGMDGASALWLPVFSMAIVLKAGFLVSTFRNRQFKWHLWLSLILAGVILIFVSLFFKYVVPVPLLRNILFFGAIALKIGGLALLLVQKVSKK